MKTLSNKYQKGIWGCIVLLFGFIIYRRYVIQRVYYPMFQEGLAVQGGSMVGQTGNKIELLQKRGKGQDQKMKDLNVKIDTVNKELDRKLNNSRSS